LAAACASCRLNQACNEIDGLMRGLLRATQQMGDIPYGTGGTIGQARQNATQALKVVTEIQSGAHPQTANNLLVECHDALISLVALAGRLCSASDVPQLASYSDRAAWASWQVSWCVYGGYP